MHFTLLSLFPEQVRNFLSESITGRALEKQLFTLETVQIRSFVTNRYGKVDDTLFGGGTGMLMQCEPIYNAWRATKKSETAHTIFLSPKGKVFNQAKALELAKHEELILICGHYEGVDQRVIDEIVDEEISIGDYVLTGGEIAACVVIDAIARLLPGVLPDSSAYEEESHMAGVLEAPQYTRPEIWHERRVPKILLSGHHEKIRQWRRLAGLYDTWQKRPDLFEALQLSEEDWRLLLAFHEPSGLEQPEVL